MQDKVCLLITVFNRSNQLRNSLLRLSKLSLPDEILIINDGGGSSCEDVVNSFKDKLPIKYIYNHNPTWSICSYARNIGIKNTDCEVIITSEPELLPVTDFIPQMLELHKNNPNHVISAGTIYHAGSKNITTQSIINNPSAILSDRKFVNISSHNTNPENPKGYVKIQGWVAPFSALYRKEWLMEINGWNEELPGEWGYEDILLLTRLRLSGINQIIAKEIEFIHQYHDKLPPNIQRKACIANEEVMKNLGLDKDDPLNPNIVANIGRQWGIIKTKQ